MAEKDTMQHDISTLPDSISEHVATSESGDAPTAGSALSSEVAENVPSISTSRSVTTSTMDSTPSYIISDGRINLPESSDRSGIPECTVTPVLSLGSDFHLSASSSSAFRPFITQSSLSSGREISSSSGSHNPITATPMLRRAERMTVPGVSRVYSELQRRTPSPSPNTQTCPVLINNTNNSEDNDDGRTTASAPPCTPAPDPYQQPQSPFRNTRQIKKIDLLAMSRSRQSDRAENARRDGRLAPSPRKKDEVLRNSGFAFPVRGFGPHSNSRGSIHNANVSIDQEVSPERVGVSSLTTASPNVDVVSVDDSQPDPSKCTFSIQFHDFAPAEQMMKCNLCGFVTNNQRFYRRHRRLHNRQYQPNLIHCRLCDYSTTQIRKMREHTITNHHMSHPHTVTNSDQDFTTPSTIVESTHRPPLQGHILIGNGSMYQPLTNRPVNLPVGATATAITDTPALGLPTYIPAPQDHHIQVNNQAGLHHPPRGPAMLGNYAPNNEQQMASYMRSVLTNLMSPSRTNPSGSVTSSGGHLQAARNFPLESQNAVPSNNVPLTDETYNTYRRYWNSNNDNNMSVSGNGFMKVKTEPRQMHISQVSRPVNDLPSSSQDRCNLRSRRPSDAFDSESGMDLSSDDHLSSPQPDNIGLRTDARTSTETNQAENIAQGEAFNNSQCSRPFIKIEFPPHTDSCSLLNHPSCARMDQGVQCEIMSMSHPLRHGSRTQSETVSSAGGSAVETRCFFCGVTFDDEVLYSIHIGCHSHTDPFVCNVCGKQCHNKYGFYSHIMRGHQSRPNN